MITKALVMLASATLAASAAPQQYESYDYAEPVKQFCLVIPEGLQTVRGILVVCNYMGGDSRGYYTQDWYSEFMNLHDFAFLGSKGDPSHAVSYQAFLRAVKQFSIDSHHPELVNAPYAITCFSAGGGFASTLLTRDPDKVIASVPVGARINFDGFKAPDAPTATHLGVPACLITGEREHSAKVVDPVFIPYRPQGALYSWMEVQGIGHDMRGQQVLAMPVLDAAVRARYPADGDVRKGPIKLRPIDPASGWVADNTTWKSGLTSIVPATQFKGDLGHSSWLQNDRSLDHALHQQGVTPRQVQIVWLSMPVSGTSWVIGFEKYKERMNEVSLEMSDIHDRNDRWAIGQAGSPFQASDIVMTDGRANRAEDKARWQACE